MSFLNNNDDNECSKQLTQKSIEKMITGKRTKFYEEKTKECR